GGRERMTKTTEDLISEINELRNELRQMREIVNMLFNIVVESESDEEDDYATSVGLGGVDQPRFNN
ncbi:MAG: hypothetical protein LUO84_06015, partial [Methanomassiliicoccales archaeon]|nr:hypothetical protein [Methanomassiliicoccales archaeon]